MSAKFPFIAWDVLEIRGAVLVRPVQVVGLSAGVARCKVAGLGEFNRPASELRRSQASALELVEARMNSLSSAAHEKSANLLAGGAPTTEPATAPQLSLATS